MEFDTSIIIFVIGATLFGILIGFFISKANGKSGASKVITNAKEEASSIMKEAKIEGEALRKEKELKAKEKFIELKAEHEKVILSREKKMAEAEKELGIKSLKYLMSYLKLKKVTQS